MISATTTLGCVTNYRIVKKRRRPRHARAAGPVGPALAAPRSPRPGRWPGGVAVDREVDCHAPHPAAFSGLNLYILRRYRISGSPHARAFSSPRRRTPCDTPRGAAWFDDPAPPGRGGGDVDPVGRSRVVVNPRGEPAGRPGWGDGADVGPRPRGHGP